MISSTLSGWTWSAGCSTHGAASPSRRSSAHGERSPWPKQGTSTRHARSPVRTSPRSWPCPVGPTKQPRLRRRLSGYLRRRAMSPAARSFARVSPHLASWALDRRRRPPGSGPTATRPHPHRDRDGGRCGAAEAVVHRHAKSGVAADRGWLQASRGRVRRLSDLARSPRVRARAREGRWWAFAMRAGLALCARCEREAVATAALRRPRWRGPHRGVRR